MKQLHQKERVGKREATRKKLAILPFLLPLLVSGCTLLGEDASYSPEGIWVFTQHSSPDYGFCGLPTSEVVAFFADGTVSDYSDYAMTTLSSTGTWSWSEGDTVEITGNDYTMTFYDHRNILLLEGETSSYCLYRMGYEPDGYVFNKTPITLNPGETKTATLTETEKVFLYSVPVTNGKKYTVSWVHNSAPDYAASIGVSAYRADKATSYFSGAINSSKTITAVGTTLYLYINRYMYIYTPNDPNDYLGRCTLTVTEN